MTIEAVALIAPSKVELPVRHSPYAEPLKLTIAGSLPLALIFIELTLQPRSVSMMTFAQRVRLTVCRPLWVLFSA